MLRTPPPTPSGSAPIYLSESHLLPHYLRTESPLMNIHESSLVANAQGGGGIFIFFLAAVGYPGFYCLHPSNTPRILDILAYPSKISILHLALINPLKTVNYRNDKKVQFSCDRKFHKELHTPKYIHNSENTSTPIAKFKFLNLKIG